MGRHKNRKINKTRLLLENKGIETSLCKNDLTWANTRIKEKYTNLNYGLKTMETRHFYAKAI